MVNSRYRHYTWVKNFSRQTIPSLDEKAGKFGGCLRGLTIKNYAMGEGGRAQIT